MQVKKGCDFCIVGHANLKKMNFKFSRFCGTLFTSLGMIECHGRKVIKNLFFRDNADGIEEIKSMPGQARYGVNKLVEFLTPIVKKGLESVLLFGVPSTIPKVY